MIKKISRFGLVGGLGTLTNLIVFTIVERNLALDPSFAATVAFLIAVSQNFYLNRLWTFNTNNTKPIKPLPGWMKYIGVNLVGFGINLITLNSLVLWLDGKQIVLYQAIGILSGMSINYILSKTLIFKDYDSAIHPEDKIAQSSLNREPLLLFKRIIILGLGLASIWHISLSLLGYSWPYNSFLFLPQDRFNDWQNTVNASVHINPYFEPNGDAISAYFPFTYWLTEPFSHLKRDISIAGYLIVSLALLILSTLTLLEPLVQTYRDINQSSKPIRPLGIAVLLLLTYPVIFSVDRGNLDLWIACLCMIYIASFYTKNKMMGIISLSIAIALKGYPMAFLVLKITERKYREAFICIAIATALTLSSLAAMEGGFVRNLDGFRNNLVLFRTAYVIGPKSLFGSSDPYNAIRILYLTFIDHNVAHVPIWSTPLHHAYMAFNILFASVCTYFVLAVRSRTWRRIMSVCLLTILFPDVANDYKLCLLIPGILTLIFDQKAKTRKESISIVLLGLLMIPKSYIYIYDRPISMLINPSLLVLLSIFVLSDIKAWRQSLKLLKYTLLWHISSWLGGEAILASIAKKKPAIFFRKRHWSLENKSFNVPSSNKSQCVALETKAT